MSARLDTHKNETLKYWVKLPPLRERHLLAGRVACGELALSKDEHTLPSPSAE